NVNRYNTLYAGLLNLYFKRLAEEAGMAKQQGKLEKQKATLLDKFNSLDKGTRFCLANKCKALKRGKKPQIKIAYEIIDGLSQQQNRLSLGILNNKGIMDRHAAVLAAYQKLK